MGQNRNTSIEQSTLQVQNKKDIVDIVKKMKHSFNVISGGTLREARKKPEEYKDLIVRSAGYSAYLVV